jgi:hypothetical protein
MLRSTLATRTPVSHTATVMVNLSVLYSINKAMNLLLYPTFLLQLPMHTASSYKIPQRSSQLLTCMKTSLSPIHTTLSLDFLSLPRNRWLLITRFIFTDD